MHALPLSPDAAFRHLPHDLQITGMGLQAAMQQLRRQQQQPQPRRLPHQPRHAQRKQCVVQHAVLSRNSAAAAADVFGGGAAAHNTQPTRAFYIAGTSQHHESGWEQQQQQQGPYAFRPELPPLPRGGGGGAAEPPAAPAAAAGGLLPRPRRGVLHLPQQPQQQQQPHQKQQELQEQQQSPDTASDTDWSDDDGVDLLAPVLINPAAADDILLQQQQQQCDDEQQQQYYESVAADIAAATTFQHLLQLFPRVAAAGDAPHLTALLLLQTVRVQRSTGADVPGKFKHSSSSSATSAADLEQSVSHRLSGSMLQQQEDEQDEDDEGEEDSTVLQQQVVEQQQQQEEGPRTTEVQQLLHSVNLLLDRQVELLQFQHISAVLWAWSQLGWRPAHNKDAGISLRTVLRRLLECPVGREKGGFHPSIGPQLARAITGCGALNVKNKEVWSKLHSIAQGSAPVLNPRELALCAWGSARSGRAQTPRSLLAWSALLGRAQALLLIQSEMGGSVTTAEVSHFDRVGALNLSWAMVAARVSHLAPAGLLKQLLQQAVAPFYQGWLQQQQQQQLSQQQQQQEACLSPTQTEQQPVQSGDVAAADTNSSTSSSSSGQMAVAWSVADLQDTAADAAAAAVPMSGLSPPELSCVLWTLAAAAKQQQNITIAAIMRRQQPQQQHQQPPHRQQQQRQGSSWSRSSKPSKLQKRYQSRQEQQQQNGEVLTTSQWLYLQQQQEQWSRDVQGCLLQDKQLLQYLAAVVLNGLEQLRPRQLAQVASAAAVLSLHTHDDTTAAAASGGAVATAAPEGLLSGCPSQQQDQEQKQEQEQQGLSMAVVLQRIWSRVLQLEQQHGHLTQFKLVEVSLLLQSVTVMQQQQQQQQQQHDRHASATTTSKGQSEAAEAGIVSAVMRRVQVAAARAELLPGTAAVLLHMFAALTCRASAERRSSSSAYGYHTQAAGAGADGAAGAAGAGAAGAAGAVADASAVVMCCADAICVPQGVNSVRARELVMAATAAGQLITAGASAGAAAGMQMGPNADITFSSSSSDSNHSKQDQQALRLLLQHLALPLAAVAPGLKLRSLANVVCAYAAADLSPPELFESVADAVQHSSVLERGSSWGLARTLAAYSAVGYVNEGLCAAVADVLTPRIRAGTLRPRVLARLAGALAAAGFHDPVLFRDIAAAVVRAQQHGTGSSSSSSSSGGRMAAVEKHLRTAQAAAEAWPGFEARDVSTLAWALATAGFKAPEPYRVLAAAGLQLLPAMTTKQVADLLWGCAVAEVCDHQLVAAVVQLLSAGQPEQQPQQPQRSMLAAASPADVATLAWSLAKLQVEAPTVLTSCAQHFVANRQQYSPADAADLARALADAGPHTVLVARTHHHHHQKQRQRQQQQHHTDELSTSSSSSSSTQDVVECDELRLEAVLVQLLAVCATDWDQISPQQLTDLSLVAAAVEAGCVPVSRLDHKRCSSMAAGSSASSGSADAASSSSSGAMASCAALNQQLWHSVSSWSPSAFSAADGGKLLAAVLLQEGGPALQQAGAGHILQQQSGRTPAAVPAAPAAAAPGAHRVYAKLLASGARALVHYNAAVRSSSFGVAVMSALAVIDSTAAAAAAPTPAAAQPCVSLTQPQAARGGSTIRTNTTTSTIASGGAAAAAASAAAAVTALVAPPPPGGRGRLDSSSSTTITTTSSSSSVWHQLGVLSTSQLLGHVIVYVDGASADIHRPPVDGCQDLQGDATGMKAPRTQQQEQQEEVQEQGGSGGGRGNAAGQRPVLLQLVPRREVPPGGLHTPLLPSWQAAVAAQLLHRQPHFVGVVLTEQEWESWGDAQLQKLQHLISSSVR